jgi:hypothetical protein
MLLWRVFDDLSVRARPAVRFTYRAVGSGVGQQEFAAGVSDWGCGDIPMSAAGFKAAAARVRSGGGRLGFTRTDSGVVHVRLLGVEARHETGCVGQAAAGLEHSWGLTRSRGTGRWRALVTPEGCKRAACVRRATLPPAELLLSPASRPCAPPAGPVPGRHGQRVPQRPGRQGPQAAALPPRQVRPR